MSYSYDDEFEKELRERVAFYRFVCVLYCAYFLILALGLIGQYYKLGG